MGNQNTHTRRGQCRSTSDVIESSDKSASDTPSPFQSTSSLDSDSNNNHKNFHPEEEPIVTQATQYTQRRRRIPKVSRAASMNGVRQKKMLKKIPGFAAVSNNKLLSLECCDILRQTWQTVLDVNDGDQTKIGLSIYSKIFKKVPELRDVFMIPKEISNIADHAPFVRSALLLSSVIALCVRNIECLESEMGPVLIMYGRRHYHREKQGFKVSYITVFTKCITEYITESLGSGATLQTSITWHKMMSYISRKLVEGVELERCRLEQR
uniref:GLOBIN domain-containing protein n=1 Tax=Syphacia muris TaxID=451379 RepID=A0A0N5AAY2_9BILA